MSIRKSLALYVFLMTGLLVVVGILLLMGGPMVLRSFQRSLNSMNVLAVIRELKSDVNHQKNSLNRYLLIGDPQELLSFQEAVKTSQQSLDAIPGMTPNNVPDWYSELVVSFSTIHTLANEVASTYERGRKTRAYDEMTSRLLPQFQQLYDRVDKLEKDKSAEAESMFETIKELVEKVEIIVSLTLVVSFILGVILFRLLYQSVMHPLATMRKGADEFGMGHWDHRINLSSPVEFETLAESFNNMAENVKQLQLQAVHMDRMSAVGQLAGGVAHEINNPLTAVLGQAQIILSRLPETDAVYSQVKKIEQAALRCKKIVRGLLDFSRPSQSTFEQVDMNSILSATLDLCEADLKKARVTIEKRVAKELPLIEGSSSELQQVLLNLITNSIQAMLKGGILSIETRSHNDPLTVVDRRKGGPAHKVPGPWVEIVVRDNGIGIAKEHLTRIFQPFFTTKAIGKGTGLGLAVSMGIVQKHGGDIRVESGGLNRGSSFVVTLPMKPAAGIQMEFQSQAGLVA